jgi:hypothetical protein
MPTSSSTRARRILDAIDRRRDRRYLTETLFVGILRRIGHVRARELLALETRRLADLVELPEQLLDASVRRQ